LSVCVRGCVWEREGERAREKERERERDRQRDRERAVWPVASVRYTFFTNFRPVPTCVC